MDESHLDDESVDESVDGSHSEIAWNGAHIETHVNAPTEDQTGHDMMPCTTTAHLLADRAVGGWRLYRIKGGRRVTLAHLDVTQEQVLREMSTRSKSV